MLILRAEFIKWLSIGLILKQYKGSKKLLFPELHQLFLNSKQQLSKKLKGNFQGIACRGTKADMNFKFLLNINSKYLMRQHSNVI